MVPVSVVDIEPNTVTALRTAEHDGYTAVQLGARHGKKLTKPRAGQLKGLPPVKRRARVPPRRRVRVHDRPDTRRDRSSPTARKSTSPACPRAGLLRHHQAPRLQARPGDARLRLAPPARLDRRGHVPGQGVQGHRHGRPHGQRPGHGQEADHRAQRRGTQPAADQGRSARRAQRAWSSSGRPSDAQHDPLLEGRQGRWARSTCPRRSSRHRSTRPSCTRP